MAVSKEDLEYLNEKFSGENGVKMLGAGLLFNSRQNSGSRLIMSSAFIGEQWIIPNHPEPPLIYTGYENAFGKYADSITRSERNYKVLDVISKFPNMPRHIYLYIVQDVMTGLYDVIDIRHYESYAETHGYIKPQTDGDLFMPGMVIPEGKVIAHAPTLDEDGNYCIGKNVNMAFASWAEVEEDGYLVSKEWAEETTFTQIDEKTKTVNTNDILTNRYGDKETYKSFPDIGEEIKDGVICTSRQLNLTFAASELTEYALRTDADADSSTPGRGKIIDIDVFVNNEEELLNNTNRRQIMFYWAISKAYHTAIKEKLGKIVNNKSNKFTPRLKMLYQRSVDFLNPEYKFSNNNGVFEFAFIRFTTAYEAHIVDGSKITDRAASKGVTCHILPRAMMPRDKYGNIADIVQSPPGIVGRANVNQTYEPELNYIAYFVRKRMAESGDTVEHQFGILYEFLEIVDKEQAEYLKANFYSWGKIGQAEYISDVILYGLNIRQDPMFKNVTYEIITFLYDKYNIHPDRVRVQRQIRKHGFNKTLLNKLKNNELNLFLDKKGEIINTFVTAQEARSEENKAKAKEAYGDDQFVYTDEYTIKGVNEGSHTLVKVNDEGKVKKQLMPMVDKTLDEIIDENWNDETYFVSEDEDTVTLSFLTEEPLIIAPKFFVILKHVPEGKLSARYIGSTSPLGLPNKTSKTDSNGPVSGTPIKYGEMELFNALIRVDPYLVYRNLSIMSKNPAMRSMLFKQLLFGNPLSYHNLPVPVGDICDDIPAKIFNAYLFCLGLEVVDEEEPDIYEAFDNVELSDEQMEKVFEAQALKYPPALLEKMA